MFLHKYKDLHIILFKNVFGILLLCSTPLYFLVSLISIYNCQYAKLLLFHFQQNNHITKMLDDSIHLIVGSLLKLISGIGILV